jgi:hypothetical protein
MTSYRYHVVLFSIQYSNDVPCVVHDSIVNSYRASVRNYERSSYVLIQLLYIHPTQTKLALHFIFILVGSGFFYPV